MIKKTSAGDASERTQILSQRSSLSQMYIWTDETISYCVFKSLLLELRAPEAFLYFLAAALQDRVVLEMVKSQ